MSVTSRRSQSPDRLNTAPSDADDRTVEAVEVDTAVAGPNRVGGADLLLRAGELLTGRAKLWPALTELVEVLLADLDADEVVLWVAAASHRPERRLAARSNRPMDRSRTARLELPLVLGAGRLGGLAVVRSGGFSVTEEQRCLGVVHLLALAVHAADLTERLAAERAESLALRGRMVAEVEQERSRVAAELHDGALQSLVAVRYSLDAARTRPAPVAGTTETGDDLDPAYEAVQGGLVAARQHLWHLRPRSGEPGALTGALLQLSGQLSRTGGVRLSVRTDAVPARLAPSVAVVAFRVVQEAVLAAARHAGARSASVRVRLRAGELFVELVDDGAGCADRLAESTGLLDWLRRSQLLGAEASLSCAAGRGGHLRLRFPRAATDEADR